MREVSCAQVFPTSTPFDSRLTFFFPRFPPFHPLARARAGLSAASAVVSSAGTQLRVVACDSAGASSGLTAATYAGVSAPPLFSPAAGELAAFPAAVTVTSNGATSLCVLVSSSAAVPSPAPACASAATCATGTSLLSGAAVALASAPSYISVQLCDATGAGSATVYGSGAYTAFAAPAFSLPGGNTPFVLPKNVQVTAAGASAGLCVSGSTTTPLCDPAAPGTACTAGLLTF